MDLTTRKQIIILLFLSLVSYLLYQIIRSQVYNVPFGLPLDDTYIHLHYARNISNGYLFQYNIGEYTPGSTSALWIIILGLLFLLSDEHIIVSVILSSFFHFVSVIVTLLLSKLYLNELSKEYKSLSKFKFLEIIPPLIVLLIGRYNWISQGGMETTLFVTLVLSGIYFHSKEIINKEQKLLPGVIFAISSITRPEGYLISILYFIDKLLFINNISKKNKIKFLILEILIYILIILPYPIFCYITTGSIFTTSFKAINIKHSENQNIRFLIIFITYLIRDIPILGIIFILNIISFFKNIKKYFNGLSYIRLFFFIIFLFPIAFTIFFPMWRNHGRYIIPIIVMIGIYSFFSLIIYVSRFENKKLFKKALISFSLLILFTSIPYYIVFSKHLSKNIDNINTMQCKAGIWVRDNLKPELPVATNDIGAIAYYSRHKILDLEGLVTPNVLKFRNYTQEQRNDSLFKYCVARQTSHMLIFDNWYPGLAEKYSKNLELVKIFPLIENTICGDDTLKVYKIIY